MLGFDDKLGDIEVEGTELGSADGFEVGDVDVEGTELGSADGFEVGVNDTTKLVLSLKENPPPIFTLDPAIFTPPFSPYMVHKGLQYTIIHHPPNP